MTSPALLALVAVLLAWPVPALLSRARWVRLAPGAAMVLWQSVALAGGLAMVGAPLLWGLEPFGDSLPQALTGLSQAAADGSWARRVSSDDLGLARLLAVGVALVLGTHLLLTLLFTAAQTVRERRRHRRLLGLLSEPGASVDREAPAAPAGTRILPHDVPLAYCLPGLTGAVTVVSRGLIQDLTPAEVQAVLAHERAHAEQHHHLLRLAFDAWRRATPWLPTTALAQDAVTELTEMLADDAALREHRRPDLVSALARTGDVRAEAAAVSSTAPTPTAVPVTLRLYRLMRPAAPMPRALQALLVGTSAVVVMLPPALLLV